MLRTTTVMTGIAGSPYYSSFHFEGTLQAEADAAAAATRTFWDGVSSSISSLVTINVQDEVEVVDVASGQTTQVYQSPTTPVSGVPNTEIMPTYSQGLVRWLTGIYVGGRQLRGRTFIPGVVEAVSSGGVPAASYIADTLAAANALLGTSDFGIYSPTHGQFVLGATASVWDQWAVLRSRRD